MIKISLKTIFVLMAFMAISVVGCSYIAVTNPVSACIPGDCSLGSVSYQGCGVWGCPEGTQRICTCVTGPNVCENQGGWECQCVNDPINCGVPPSPPPGCSDGSWGACSGGTQCKTDSCGNVTCRSCSSGGSCTKSAPGAPFGLSPANNTQLTSNSFDASWNHASQYWGSGCPNNNQFVVEISPKCTGTWTEYTRTNENRTYTTVSNLNWGTKYCWRVGKDNGPFTAYSGVYAVYTNNPPSYISSGFTNADVCGTGFSGSYNSNPAEVTNPVTYQVSYEEPEGEPFEEIILAIVPHNGPYMLRNIITPYTAVYSTVNNAKTIAVKYNFNSKTFSYLKSDGTWSAGVTSGNISNDWGTVTILNIGSVTTASTSGNTATATFQVRFEDSFTDDNIRPASYYNFYTAGISNNGGTLVSDSGNASWPIRFKRHDQWGVDTVPPDVNLVGPTPRSGGRFDILWTSVDNAWHVTDVYSYIYSDNEVTELDSNLLGPNIIAPDTPIGYPNDASNAGVTRRLDPNTNRYIVWQRHYYTNITSPGSSTGLNFELVTKDTACNSSQNTVQIQQADPWVMFNEGSISSAGGIKGIDILNIDSLSIEGIRYQGPPYISTGNLISGDSNIPQNRLSANNLYTTNYPNSAASVPPTSSYDKWYDHLLDRATKNTSSSIKSITRSSINGVISGNISGRLGATQNKQTFLITGGNITINSGTKCDMQALIFINGNLRIEPDFTNTADSDGCIFVVNGDVTIGKGSAKTAALQTSPAPALYDIVEGFIITDNLLTTELDDLGVNNKWDGLIFKGGVYANQINFLRSLNDAANSVQPAQIFQFDPKYREVFQDEFASRFYSIR